MEQHDDSFLRLDLIRRSPGCSRTAAAALTAGALVFAAACGSPAGPAAGQPADSSTVDAAASVAPPVEIPLDTYMGPLRAVEVTVAGVTLPFLFDTGGGATLVTPAVAAAMGCEPYGSVTGFRHDGERLDLPRCDPAALTLGGVEVTPEIGVFDLMVLLPEDFPELGGILSLDTFEDRAITLDLAGGRLVLETPESLAARTAGMRRLTARPSHQGGGETLDYFVAVAAERGTLWLEVDSGNAGAVLLAPHALRRLGHDPAELARDRASGEPQPRLTLDLVGFGPVEVPVAVKEGIIYDGLLDAGTMQRMTWTFDLPRRAVWAAWNEPAPGAGTTVAETESEPESGG